MLTLYKSSSLNTLFEAWSDVISQPSPGGPLRPRSVIVPNMDMAQWLQVHQAERSGISANIDFQLPAGYFRKIFESRMGLGAGSVSVGKGLRSGSSESAGVGSDDPAGRGLAVESGATSKTEHVEGAQPKQVQRQLLDKHHLRWMAFTLLGEALETGRYPHEWEVLVEWIKSATQKGSGSRDMTGIRWDLAGQIADVFDQYIMYRPHWLREWAGLGGRDFGGDIVSSDAGQSKDYATSDAESDNGFDINANKVGRGNSPGDGRKIMGSTSTSIVGLEGMNAWQPSLWGKIRSRWGEYPNRADLMLGLVDEMRGGDGADLAFPPQIVIFGIQSVAPILLEALILKSKYVDVHWFQRDNECIESFSDDFLSDLSADQRDQSNLMLQLIVKHNLDGDTIVLDSNTRPPSTTPNSSGSITSTTIDKNEISSSNQSTTSIGKDPKPSIKGDSSTFKPSNSPDRSTSIPSVNSDPTISIPPVTSDLTTPIPATFPKIISTPDAISIHRCHSPRREVEVLYDTLLHLFETKEIRPGDVAIVTPDVDLYAPFVREVFHSSSENQIRIPIRVSGGQLNERELVADVLLKALDIANSRFKATEILDWLGLAPVLGDFLDETGLRSTLNRWIEEQNIRWGSGQNHIKDVGFELEGRHSWMCGLHRILLARIASEDQDVVFDGQLSGSAITSKNENMLLGRLLSIISALDEFRVKSKSAHALSDWSDFFQDLLETIVVNEKWTTKCDKIRSVLHGMKQVNEDLLTEDVSLEIARDFLKLRLESGGLGRAWHPGFVTFTGMVALHQFPYKVVAMIGLNDGSLPGRTPITAFDLISKNHQSGDRIRRQADRQMFLDYLVTTQDVLHISYTGLRQTDNKPLAPSVMITSLVDNIKRWNRTYEIPVAVEIEHRLQPFHSSYFDGSGVTKSYSKYYAEIAKKLQGTDKIKGSIIPELKPGKHPSLREIFELIDGLGSIDAGFGATSGSSSELAIGDVDRGISNNDDLPAVTVQFSLSNLVSFYNNPIKYTLRNGYGIDLYESDVPDEDVEPFDLNALDKWKIRGLFHEYLFDELKKGGVSHVLDASILESISVRLGQEGILPDAIAGRRSMDYVINELSHIWDSVRHDQLFDFSSALVQKSISRVVSLTEEVEVNVSGEIDICVNDTYFGLEAGSIKQKKILQHWIYHVLLNCVGPVKSRIYFKEQKRVDFAELSIEEASIRLANLLFIYALAERFLIPIFPECSDLYLKYVQNGDSVDAKNSIRRIIDATSGDPGGYASEMFTEIASVWASHAWADRHPLSSSVSFKNLTPDQLQVPADFIIKMSDFEEFDAFSVISVKLFGLMKGDLA